MLGKFDDDGYYDNEYLAFITNEMVRRFKIRNMSEPQIQARLANYRASVRYHKRTATKYLQKVLAVQRALKIIKGADNDNSN